MRGSISEHIKNLKSSLLKLKATGEAGFEGLIGVALREITNAPFRLASSGFQRGIDGKTAFEEDSICFEGKLYKDSVPRTEVITKIADLARNGINADLIWVLGATSQVPTQLADDVRADGKRSGVSVLILDWSETDIPPLVVALAIGGERVVKFLRTNLEPEYTDDAITALDTIRRHNDFTSLEQRIRTSFDVPAMGTVFVREANIKWLTSVISDKARARDELGQPLAPADPTLSVTTRDDLLQKLKPFFIDAPSETIVCVHGSEGSGKSWIVMQTWHEQDDKPLLVFLTPDRFRKIATQNSIEDLLVQTLITQTGDRETVENQSRWYRRIESWRDNRLLEYLRFIVVIDGVNQRPDYEWGKILTKAANAINRLGGRLIFTSRTQYFQHRIKRALTVDCVQIFVPEWTPDKRDVILKNHGIETGRLNHTVAESLRNPRLLAIALELFDQNDVEAFEELSVSRLLFEHIRAGVREDYGPDPVEFVGRLRKHAAEILNRVEQKKEEDRNIFEADTPAVADGRFYHTVEGEPGKIELRDDGLILALGYSIIAHLRSAKRNSGELRDTLERLLEPIAALDNTADVMLAALTVIALDEDEYASDIATALITGFANLQNPDAEKYPVFEGLAKVCPKAFVESAKQLCLSGTHASNSDWIDTALFAASRNKSAWSKISEEIGHWLSAYTLAPEHGMLTQRSHDAKEKVDAERIKKQTEIDERLAALSSAEEQRKNQLLETVGDLAALSRLAFIVLSQKPLAPFAESLVNWSFAQALNPSYRTQHNDFIHLISLNCRDWLETRKALLDASQSLRDDKVSRTGKWTLVTILRATGEPDDDKDANTLVEELTKDRPKLSSWRLLDDYCSVDPCDPSTQKPSNLADTNKQYAALNVSDLRTGMGQTREDYLLADGRPAIARFAVNTAVSKHREFFDDVLNRSGLPLHSGLLETRKNNALLTTEQARKLVELWKKIDISDDSEGLTDRGNWSIRQYHLLVAFPLLDANEQAELLLSSSEDEAILLELMDEMKAPGQETFDRLLNEAISNDNEYEQYLLFIIAKTTGLELPAQTRDYICSLIASKSKRLRAAALGVIARSAHPELLAGLAKSSWAASDENAEQYFESWYGSIALLEAARGGLLSKSDALNRISRRLYGRAAGMLGNEVTQDIARRIDASIRKACGLEEGIAVPDIEMQIDKTDNINPALFSVSEKEPPEMDFHRTMKRISESNKAFEEQQKRNFNAFEEFKNELTSEEAQIILDNISLEEFSAIVSGDPEMANRWYELFMRLNDRNLPFVYNLIILLAHAIAVTDQGKSKALFQRIRFVKPITRITYTCAAIALDAMAVWSKKRSSILDEVHRARLNDAVNDQALALEVLAALENEQSDLLQKYVEEKLKQAEPAEKARGILVAGFSDQCSFSEQILSQFEDTLGLPGHAFKAAQYAYERNRWARHWFERMCSDDNPDEFWQASVLFLRIVDGRFAVWQKEYERKGIPVRLFGLSVSSQLQNRFKKWKSKREKKLFGQDAPAPIFLGHGEL